MSRHFNTLFVTGIIDSQPTIVTIKNNKRMLLFTLKSVERFNLADGTPAEHINFFPVEVLGKNIDRYGDILQKGKPCAVHGYLRADIIDGDQRLRIRSLRFEEA